MAQEDFAGVGGSYEILPRGEIKLLQRTDAEEIVVVETPEKTYNKKKTKE